MVQTMRRIGTAAQLMTLSFFLWGLGEGLWLYLQALYPKSLGASHSETGLVLGMLGAGRLVALPLFIYAVGRYNPRDVMFPGYICGLLGMVIVALSPTWQASAVGFFIFAFSYPTLIPISLYLSDAMEHDHTRHPSISLHNILSMTFAGNALGIIFAPALGGWLAERFDLRSVFMLSAVWFTFSTLPVFLTQRFPHRPAPTLSVENRQLFRNSNYLWMNILFLAIFTASTLGFSLVAEWLKAEADYSVQTIGFMGMISALGMVIWNVIMGRQRLRYGFLFSQVSIGAAFLLLLLDTSILNVSLAYFLYAAWYATRGFTTGIIARLVTPHQQGVAFSIIDLLYGVAALVGPILAGQIYDSNPTLPIALGALTISITLLFSLWKVLPRNEVLRYPYQELAISE
jgi:predicted MFS family arabinose efflux permease